MGLGKAGFSLTDRGIARSGCTNELLTEMTVADALVMLGIGWSRDRLDRLRTVGITGAAEPRPSKGNQRFFLARDVERLRAIKEIHQRFDVTKIPASELAFWLAAGGDEQMPPTLVLSHIRLSAANYADRAVTLMGRLVGARYLLEKAAPSSIYRVVKSCAKVIRRAATKRATSARGLVVLHTLIDIFVSQMLRTATYNALAKKSKSILEGIGLPKELVNAWAPGFYRGIDEFSSFFARGERNALVRAVTASADLSSACISRLACHSLAAFSILKQAYPELIVIDRDEVPLIAGLLLHLRDNAATNEFRARLESREGTDKIMHELSIFKRQVTFLADKVIGRD